MDIKPSKGFNLIPVHTEEPLLSVICVFRNRNDWVEPTLKALYSIKRLPCEFIFLDDASTDGTADTLRSLIEYYQHDQTFFFEQEAPRGRGNSVNSALEQVRGRILWIPESISEVDQDLLLDAVQSLVSSNAVAAVAVDEPVPQSAMDWLQLLQNDRLPYDRNLLFDLSRIRPGRTFVDPHWTTRHASEWAIRLQAESDPLPVKIFAKGENKLLAMDDRSKKECILALLRIPELSLSGQEKAFRLLRSYGHTDVEEEEGSLELLYQEAQSLYKTGNSVAALKILNRILAADPGHRRSRIFKIQILEKMRRYVEAAELKHGFDISQVSDDAGKSTETPGATDSADTESESDADELVSETDSADTESESDADEDVIVTEAAENKGIGYSEGTGLPDEKELAGSETPEKEEAGSSDETPIPDESGNDEPSEETDVQKNPIAVAGNTEQDGNTETGDATETENSTTQKDNVAPGSKTAQKSSSALSIEIDRQPDITIIIPTSTIQRPLLEDCLASVFRYTSPVHTRLIIIDNGSVDDTAEFLDQLVREHPAVTILRNDQNLGFAAAINKGLATADTGLAIVMHNDVILKSPVPARLAHILNEQPDIGVIAPRTDHTWNKAQLASLRDETDFTEVDLVDSFFMVFRNEPGLTMSKKYGLAFFEDADFCYRMQKKGLRIVIDNREEVVHMSGRTARDLGIARYSKPFWKNASIFHKEWSIEPQFPEKHTRVDPLRQFVVLGELINPFYPETHLLDYFHQLFTSEQKTRVLHTEFPPEALKSMIRLMMASNQREVLRNLEQQLEALPADIRLYSDLVTYYYDRTIYSRCKMYLNRLEESQLTTDLSVYRLKVAIGEKDYSKAALFLKELMNRIPTHPEVLISAAEIHRKSGNREQSEKFVRLARTFDPYVTP